MNIWNISCHGQGGRRHQAGDGEKYFVARATLLRALAVRGGSRRSPGPPVPSLFCAMPRSPPSSSFGRSQDGVACSSSLLFASSCRRASENTITNVKKAETQNEDPRCWCGGAVAAAQSRRKGQRRTRATCCDCSLPSSES